MLLAGCGVTHPVRTLPEGSSEVVASIGGPLIPFNGMTIPVPYANFGVAMGITSDVTVTANVHALMLAFGNVGCDFGAATQLITESGWRPEVVGKAEVYFFSDFTDINNLRAFPRISATASYKLGPVIAYGGGDLLAQFTGEDRVFFSPYAGSQIALGGPWSLLTEIKWMAANADTRHGVFEGHASIAGRGNVGLFFGVTYAY